MFKDTIGKIVKIEGGYSDHQSDSGGKTMHGVTERLARRWGYKGDMYRMPLVVAYSIYEDMFWKPLNLEKISAISPSIIHEVLDTGINQGVDRAGEYLQTSLNALNRQGRDFADLHVDGDIGPATLRALRQYVAKRGAEGEMVLLRCLNCLQGTFYISLSQRRQKDEDFVYGWVLNRVEI